jgi:nickel transport protein
MRSFLLALLLLMAAMSPAAAHRLKLFATVEAGAIVGYAFFVGGGRPAMAMLLVRDANGTEVHRGGTDAAGAFRWQPPAVATYRLVVHAGDGHSASTTITADRLGGVASPPALAAPVTDLAPAGAPCAAGDLAALVDAAVARQVAPLLEAHAAAEARLRFNDVVGGIGMILGLGGIWAWAAARRPSMAPGAGR